MRIATQDVQDPGDYKRALVSMFGLQTLIERSRGGAAVRLDRKGKKKKSVVKVKHRSNQI